MLTDTSKRDYVIGNPPYLRAVEIDREKRGAYCEAIDSMTRGCDLLVGIIDDEKYPSLFVVGSQEPIGPLGSNCSEM